jgi:methionine aminotransferase
MAGLPELRTAVAAKYQHWFSLPLDPETEITVTPGGTAALFTACATVLSPGSRMLVFEPAYDSYGPAAMVQGAEVLRSTLRPPEYRPDWDEVRSLCADGIDLIVVNTPHNPTGTVWQWDDVEMLAALCEQHDCLVLSDEVYDLITFDVSHKPLASHPALRDRTLTVMSFGKLVNATGWKVGVCIAPPLLTAEFRKVHQYLSFSVSTPMQYGLAQYSSRPEVFEGLAKLFAAKRRLFVDALEGSPWIVRPCSGTYFQLLDYSAFWEGADVSLAELLTRVGMVASIPLSPFTNGVQRDSALRFCFAKQDDVLLRAAGLLNAAPEALNRER